MKLGLEQIVSLVVSKINAVGLEKVSIALENNLDGYAVRVHSENGRIASNVLEGVSVDEASVSVSKIKLGLAPQEMLNNAEIKVDRVAVRVSADLLNSFLASPAFKEELRRNAPVEINGLRFVFANGRVSIRGEVKKLITIPFTVDLDFKAVENGVKVIFADFLAADMMPLPAMIRRLIMSVAKQKISSMASLKGIAEITDDYVIINPWPKIPIKNLNAAFSKFGVQGTHFVVELGPNESYKKEPAEAKPEASAAKEEKAPEHAPVKEEVKPDKNEKGEMLMPLPPF